MKNRDSQYKNALLSDADSPLKIAAPPKRVTAITANVCEEKNACPLCGRGDRYGIPLVFILHYEYRSIDTVCYRCGANASKGEGVRRPFTEAEIYEKMMKREGV